MGKGEVVNKQNIHKPVRVHGEDIGWEKGSSIAFSSGPIIRGLIPGGTRGIGRGREKGSGCKRIVWARRKGIHSIKASGFPIALDRIARSRHGFDRKRGEKVAKKNP